MVDASIFLWVALILISTKFMSLLFKRVHMPQMVGALLAGILLGPAVLGWASPNEAISVLAEFGVILLLFTAGMETDLKELKNSVKSSFFISIVGAATAIGAGFAVSAAFGMSALESFFIGVAIAATSTTITVEALHEMGKLKSKTGSIAIGASIFDDIMIIVLLAVLAGLGTDGETISALSIATIFARIVAFFIFAILTGYVINKIFNWMYSRIGEKGRFSIFAIAYCFLMAYLAEMFGLANITGAYIAGIAFCTTRNVESLETNTHTLSYMLFTPIFLANIGLNTSFEAMNANIVIFTVALVAVTILSKIVGCGLVAKLSKYSTRESLQIGIGMIARGEVSLVVINKGIALGLMSALVFPSVIVVVFVSVMVMPILLKLSFKGEGIQT
ncbi:MAG: cation:proton antiporter [Turicibacter sp.]|nr:cation:proton antiporter [Turicibacter sp.]